MKIRILAILNHNKKNKTVHICFAEIKDHKIISQEEAIFEEEDFYKIMKKWLVQFDNKPLTENKHRALLNNCVDNDEVILHKREIEGVKG